MTYAPINSESPYLPVSLKFDDKFDVLIPQLLRMYSSIAYRLNNREISIYDLQERITGQKWTDSTNLQTPKETFRIVLEFAAIAPGATLNIAHGINTIAQFTKIYGTCITATPDFRPIPYASATAVNQQIEVNVDAANVNIINGAGAPNISSGLIVLEYLKN